MTQSVDPSDPAYRLSAVAFNAVGAALGEASADKPDFPALFLSLDVRALVAERVLKAVLSEQGRQRNTPSGRTEPSMFEPSTPPVAPYAFIQWKGTSVCLDLHCRCGAQGHLDADFAYGIRCNACGTVWEMPTFLVPRESDEDSVGVVQEIFPTSPTAED